MTIGVLGCMAERLKSKFLEEEKLVDLVVGPDAYRDLPNLIESTDFGQKAVNVQLSKEETYADISPVEATLMVNCLCLHYAWLRQHVHFLCGSFYPRKRKKQKR